MGLNLLSAKVKTYKDFRKLLEHKDIDAVIVATPEHWHAIPMIDGVRGRQRRVRGEADFPHHSGRPADGGGGQPEPSRRSVRHPATLG